MTKHKTDVTLDLDIWNAAKKKGINISEACNDGLKRAVGVIELQHLSDDQLKEMLAKERRKEALQRELNELNGC